MALHVGGAEEEGDGDVGHQRHAAGGRDVGAADHFHHHHSGHLASGAADICRRRPIWSRRPRPENITIAVDKQGAIYWNTKLLSGQDELQAQLRGIARQEPQPEVHIRGDSNVRYQFVGQVLVATQKIGIRKVAFITEPDRPTSR